MTIEELITTYIKKQEAEGQVAYWNEYCRDVGKPELKIEPVSKIGEIGKARKLETLGEWMMYFGDVFRIKYKHTPEVRESSRPVAPYMTLHGYSCYKPVQIAELPNYIDMDRLANFYAEHIDTFNSVDVTKESIPDDKDVPEESAEYLNGGVVSPNEVYEEFLTMPEAETYGPLNQKECEAIASKASDDLENDDEFLKTVYTRMVKTINEYVENHKKVLAKAA